MPLLCRFTLLCLTLAVVKWAKVWVLHQHLRCHTVTSMSEVSNCNINEVSHCNINACILCTVVDSALISYAPTNSDPSTKEDCKHLIPWLVWLLYFQLQFYVNWSVLWAGDWPFVKYFGVHTITIPYQYLLYHWIYFYLKEW